MVQLANVWNRKYAEIDFELVWLLTQPMMGHRDELLKNVDWTRAT